jgi:hypothetical protein
METLKYRILTATLLIALAWPAVAAAQILPSFGRDRAGTSGFQFLKIPVDARSAGMGQTVAANAMDASSLFWNPALAAQTQGKVQVGLGHTSYHAGIALDYGAALYTLGGVTLGFSIQTLNSGEMDVTTEFEPLGTGETFRAIDVAAGLTVAQSLTDLFSYGVTAKWVQENIASVTANTVVFDLGVFYRVGTTGAQMAVSIRNFGLDSTPSGDLGRIVISEEGSVTESDFESLTPPTTFLLGLTYNVFNSNPEKSLLLSVQLNNPNDNAESLNLGAEYEFSQLITLRTGYRLGVEEITTPSFGVGLTLPGLGPDVRFDYGFSRLDRLGTIHRVGLDVRL